MAQNCLRTELCCERKSQEKKTSTALTQSGVPKDANYFVRPPSRRVSRIRQHPLAERRQTSRQCVQPDGDSRNLFWEAFIDPRTTAAALNICFARHLLRHGDLKTKVAAKPQSPGGNPASAEDRHPRQFAEKQTTDSGFINNHERRSNSSFGSSSALIFFGKSQRQEAPPRRGWQLPKAKEKRQAAHAASLTVR